MRRKPILSGLLILTTTLLTIGFLYSLYKYGYIPSPLCMVGKIQGVRSGEIPDLYSGVNWLTPKQVNDYSYSKFWSIKGYRVESLPLKVYPTNFSNYYKRELELRCWLKTGGAELPGGFWYTYKKNDHHFVYGVIYPRYVSSYNDAYKAYVVFDQ